MNFAVEVRRLKNDENYVQEISGVVLVLIRVSDCICRGFDLMETS